MEQLLIIDLALAGIYTVLLVGCSIIQAKDLGRREEAVTARAETARLSPLTA